MRKRNVYEGEMPGHHDLLVHSIIINLAAGNKQCARLCRLFNIIFGVIVCIVPMKMVWPYVFIVNIIVFRFGFGHSCVIIRISFVFGFDIVAV